MNSSFQEFSADRVDGVTTSRTRLSPSSRNSISRYALSDIKIMASGCFSMYMFEEDKERIRSWVLDYPDLETGGSLFGLWTNGRNPVVHITLGPGENCRRTGYSFYQDLSYLERVGNIMTGDYMLCHIGEWHSHHRLGLDRPSGGDVSTVVRNYPTGVCGFILMIVNIVSRTEVKLSPFMFTGSSAYYHGNVIRVRGKSPFRNIPRISGSIKQGEELPLAHYPAPTDRFRARADDPRKRNMASKRQRHRFTKSPDRLLPNRNTYRDAGNINDNDVRLYPRNPAAVDASKCTRRDQWYSKTWGENLLKAIHEGLASYPATSDVKMTRDTDTQNLCISFMHHRREWEFEFPSNFPVQSPVLKTAVPNYMYTGRQLSSPTYPFRTSDNGSKSILEKIKESCSLCKQRLRNNLPVFR